MPCSSAWPSWRRRSEGAIREFRDIEQTAGKALGYAWFKDDKKNFPEATEADGVCIGEHVPGTIVAELVSRFTSLQADHARVLGLVQALDGRFWNYEQKMCDRERAGLTKEQRTGACIVLHWLNEQIKAASLPAQRAKLAQGGASKEAMT